VATNGAVPPLRNATHHVDVTVSGGHVKVAIDGAPVLDQAVAVPNQALLAFTAGTGGLTDRHSITNVAIQPPAPSLAVAPTSLDLGAVAVGQSASQPITISNVGTAPLTIQELNAAGGPFRLTGPAPGTVLGAGQSVGAVVTLAPPAGGVWRGTATVATSAGDASVLLAGSGTGAVPVVAADSTFTPVQPYRLLDTRDAALSPGGQAGPLPAGQELAVDLSTQPGAPTHPSAAMLNVTVTDPVAAGFVRAYPCGSAPGNSTVNFGAGQTAANLATVRVPADGRVCFWSMVDTNLVIDVAGWYAPPGAAGAAAAAGVAYQTVEPVRVLDTRRADLAPTGQAGPLAAGQEVAFTLAGRAGFPADAHAALLNLTVTEPDGPGYLRVYPCGEEQVVSNVNFVAGQTVANLAAVKVAAGGQVCFRASATAHLVVDLAGWYAPGPGADLATPDPVRVLDTRSPDVAAGGVAQPLAAGGELALQITGYDGVPAGASSVVLNVTATNTAADGYVAAYPCGTAPLVSNVNYRAGQVAAANLAVVKLSADGRVCFTSFATTDLVLDLAGWYVG
jgi:HYDIN/CFA65/VesB-like, Ig-like domain